MSYPPESEQPDYLQSQSSGSNRPVMIGIVGGLVVMCICIAIAAGMGIAGTALSTQLASSIENEVATTATALAEELVNAPSLETPLPPTVMPNFTETPSSDSPSAPTAAAMPEIPGVEEVPVTSIAHIPEGTLDISILSNPPTSGPHYAPSLEAGFYTEVIDPGYIIHSMEHGYIVLWYNCDHLPASGDCDALKAQIQQVVENNGEKLIGVVYEPLNVPVAVSSWQHKLEMDSFDEELVLAFIDTYRYVDSPEPNAP